MGNEFENGAVCFAGGWYWFYDCGKASLSNLHGSYFSLEGLLSNDDFQLNTIKQGDYIEASELDTENKYNDAVEVFELFGFEFEVKEFDFIGYNYIFDDECKNLKVNTHGYLVSGYIGNRKLTYNQLMAIGKLKRLMNERNNLKRWGEYSRCVQVDLGDVKTIDPCAGGFSVGYECNTSEKPNSSENDKNLTISANKYEREISDRQGNSAIVDVYDVLKAFEVTCPATQHALKKLLCSGLRGHKDLQTDLLEAKESITRAIELNG